MLCCRTADSGLTYTGRQTVFQETGLPRSGSRQHNDLPGDSLHVGSALISQSQHHLKELPVINLAFPGIAKSFCTVVCLYTFCKGDRYQNAAGADTVPDVKYHHRL